MKYMVRYTELTIYTLQYYTFITVNDYTTPLMPELNNICQIKL